MDRPTANVTAAAHARSRNTVWFTRLGSLYVFLVLSRVITGAAGVATFPRQVEYGVPAGEASTVVARS